MLFDAVRRLFGISSNQPRNDHESEIRFNGNEVPYRPQLPPDINQLESDITEIHKFMEEQMLSIMGAFGFTFSEPFSGFEDDSRGQFRSFPFPSIPNFPHPSDDPLIGPESGPPAAALNPRDEVLKPEYRSQSSQGGQWEGQDQVLDERINKEGLDSIIKELKATKDPVEHNNLLTDGFSSLFGNGIFGNILFGGGFGGSTPNSRSFSSSSTVFRQGSTVTIYSNVNGRTSVEKIVTHPDGKIEKTVITNDGNSDQ